MATTFADFTGDGNATKAFSFPSIKEADIKVEVDGTVYENRGITGASSGTTTFTITSYTTTGGGNVVFDSAPANPLAIRIFRDTDVDSPKATFTAGSSVKAGDLNNNMTQILYAAQEEQNQTILTSDIKDAAVTTAKIKADNITSALIADDQINSEHYVDGSIDTAHIADSQITSAKIADGTIVAGDLASNAITTVKITDSNVTTAKIADSNVTTAKIADSNVTTAKIAADAVTGAKIADDQINSEHYVSGSIDTEHIADSQVTTAKIADSNVTTAKIADSNVTTAKIADSNVTTAKIAADAITGAKIADDSINSEHYVDGSIDTAHIADSQITSAKIADDNILTAKIADNQVTMPKLGAGNLPSDINVQTANIADSNITTAKIAADAITSAKIADDQINSEHYVDGSIDTAHIADSQITTAKIADANITTAKILDNNITVGKIADGELKTLAGMQSGTASKLADSTALTADIADLNQIDGMQKATTVTDDDTKFPTSGAIVDYVAAQLEPFGGFEAIANESSFPNTQPVSGVCVSIADAGGMAVSSTGTASGATIGGTTVNISGIPTNFRGTSINAGVRFIVVSTGTNQNYTYHKATLKEDDLANLSGDINDFSERYRVGSSNPTTSLDNGDLFFNTGTGKMLVYNGTNTAWEEVQSVGNFFINTISAFSGTGGNSATPNGTAYKFTLSNAGLNAEQHLVSVDGVVQKPNSGTSQPSEGFAIDGAAIIFGSAPVSGASIFVITIGSTVNIGIPSNNTVTTAILQNGSVTTAKITDANVTTAKIADDAVTADKIANSINTAIAANTAKTTNATHTGEVTGGTALTIADNVVDEANLKVSNSPSNGYFLSAQSGNTGGLTWAQVTTDLVGDTSPQLGGDLDTNSFEILLDDNHAIRFGNDNDLQIKHDSANWIRSMGTNTLNFTVNGGNEYAATMAANGAVELYYDNTKRFETNSGGCTVTGTLTTTSGINAGNNVSLNDNIRLKLGTGDDLQIYHDGSHSRIVDSGTGSLVLQTDSLLINNAANSESMIQVFEDGAVNLFFNHSKKFETQSAGTLTTGYLTSNLAGGTAGQGQLNLGSSGAPNIRGFDTGNHGSGSKLELISGDGDDHIVCKRNGAVELFYDASKKFETESNGAQITGSLQIEGGTVNGDHDATLYVSADNNNDWGLIVDYGTNSSGKSEYGAKIVARTGSTHAFSIAQVSGGSHAEAFLIDGDGNIDKTGHILPRGNGSFDLGSTSYRWRNVYTNDLHLSNEGHSNDVDGTWGNWTIQEGESDLFLKNNRSGKKYKFNLTEVS